MARAPMQIVITMYPDTEKVEIHYPRTDDPKNTLALMADVMGKVLQLVARNENQREHGEDTNLVVASPTDIPDLGIRS